MPIPAVAPPVAPGTPTSLPPGTRTSRLTGAIDDTGPGGSGLVIPLNAVDDAYVDWRMQGLDGWDSADLQELAEAKFGEDGAFDAQNFYGARTVTITGLLTAPTYEAREAAEYQLRQAVPPRRLIQLRIDETTPKYVMGRRSGRLLITPLDDVHSKWSAVILAPDPRKYGVVAAAADLAVALPPAGLAPPWTPPITLPTRVGANDTVTVTNTGSYETQPLVRLVGPGRGFEIENRATGRTLLYDLELGPTDFLLIDCHAGVALLNGVAPRSPAPGSAVTSRWVIVPGDNTIQLRGVPTDPALVATASIQFNPAWD
ncbi:MAG: phage distal tail protein [Actinoallomurus sp.]